MEIIDSGYEHVRSIQNTYKVNKKDKNEGIQIEYNDDLGLACETLPEGDRINDLWKIV